jgi:glycosyltransferase involved in cell wall biosynthesis
VRVIALPSDETGCGCYRVIWPAAMVADAHPDWTVDIYRPRQVSIAVDDRGQLAALQGLDPRDADVVIMQRIGTPAMFALMRWFQDRGTAVVLDADDALWSIHHDNVAWKAWNNQTQHWRWMDAAAREADLVTVTTQRLADRYGKHGRIEVLPNRVPVGVTQLREPDTEPRPLRFGWTGYVGTHPTDLHVIGTAASRIMAETDTECLIIGDGQGILSAWELREHAARVTATGSLPIEQYFDALNRLDVGLIPLEDSLFNRCKSGLKAAELAAAGVPVVASPTPAHTALAREGFPLLTAEKSREWYEQTRQLLTVPDLRAELAEKAHQAACTHTLENHIERWAGAWQRAAVRRSRMKVAG